LSFFGLTRSVRSVQTSARKKETEKTKQTEGKVFIRFHSEPKK